MSEKPLIISSSSRSCQVKLFGCARNPCSLADIACFGADIPLQLVNISC